eukprot:TRINITY_DN2023_c0_g4_i2.p3 TRINITY_DN2023_c0_g4~~TRINITY_DN2023_c0_g4_i2.p3  ORF type:complete len:149 (+),score=19.01 TRINITY_DN2023_c0_g4_i2:94-540(+)
MRAKQWSSWKQSSSGSWLKEIKHKAGVSPYLFRDNKHAAQARARLRIGAKLNARQFAHGAVSSDLCSTCAVPETRSHFILHCQHHDLTSRRFQLESDLQRHDITFSFSSVTALHFLLGEMPAMTADKSRLGLDLVGQFLVYILKLRGA